MLWPLLILGALIVLAEYYGEQGAISMGTVSDKIRALGQAIAQAEGYTRGPGFIPYDRNNPGDLIDPATGQYRTFATPEEGFQALYDKLQFDTSGASAIYHPSMTWQQFGWMWVNGTAPGANLTHPGDMPDAWAATVAAALQVDPLSTVADYLNS